MVAPRPRGRTDKDEACMRRELRFAYNHFRVLAAQSLSAPQCESLQLGGIGSRFFPPACIIALSPYFVSL
jgi:hypothetical protein